MLQNWSAFIDPVEFNNLTDFVNQVKNGNILVNKFCVINGDSCTGKTTLLNDIINEIGQNECVNFHFLTTNQEFENNKLEKKLIFFNQTFDQTNDNECQSSAMIKEIISRQKYFSRKILYDSKTEPFIPTANIIIISSSLNTIDDGLLKRAIIINLTHKFN